MKRIAIIQSSYIPWKGYFDLIHDVDEFIFFDDVQFTTRDWRTRNRIKTANGLLWLSIPAGSNRDRRICDVTLSEHAWQAHHWKSIQHAYSAAPFFDAYRQRFEAFYLGRDWTSLSELNQALTRTIARDILGITTAFTDSRDYPAIGHKTERLVTLVAAAHGTHYLSGPSARDYIEPEMFAAHGIELEYKNYDDYPEYLQPYPPFEHSVSILDLIFNAGPAAPEFIWGHRGSDP